MIKDRQGKHHSEKNGQYLPKDIGDSEQNSSGTPAEKEKLKKEYGIDLDKREKKSNLTNEEQHLQELTGEKLEKELTEEEKKKEKRRRYRKKKEQVAKEIIQSFEPIKLQIRKNGKLREIQAKFTVETANENVYEYNRKTKENEPLFEQSGYNYKMKNLDKLPQIIVDSKYIRSKRETGKETTAHLDAKRWHYFRNIIQADNGRSYQALTNIKETITGQYVVYLIKITKNKKKPTKK